MEQIEATIDIDRPASEVFAYVADVNNMPNWQPQVVETVSADPPALGAKFEQRVATPMRDVDSTGEITVFDEGRRVTLVSSGGPMTSEADFEFVENDGVTTVKMNLQVDATKAFKLALPVVTRAMKKSAPDNLALLKSLIEDGGDSAE